LGTGTGEEETPVRRHWISQRGATVHGRKLGGRDFDRPRQRVSAEIGLLVVAPGGVLGSQARRAVEIDDRRRIPFAPARRLQHQLAVLVHVPAAVEDQPVVGADEIDISDRALVVRGAGGDQLSPRLDDPDPIDGGRDVRHDLGTGVGAALHRPVRTPDVLANLGGHRPEVEPEEHVAERNPPVLLVLQRDAAGHRPALIVDAVGRQFLLRHQPDDPAPGHDHGTVVAQPLVDDGDPHHEHGRHVRRLAGEPLQLVPLPIDEPLPLDQVFGRVAADHLLRK
jgi:hypothetical protein